MLRSRPRALALALLLLVAVPLAGCDDDPAQPAGAAAPIMALDVGNAWDYAWRLNEPAAPIETFRRVVTEHREITVDGQSVTVAVEMPVAPDPAHGWVNETGRLLRNEPDGLYYYGRVLADGELAVGRPTLMVPRDLQAGTTYATTYGDLLCVAADSTLTTDFGSVQAAVCEYVLDEGTVRVPVFVVPGVGLTLYYNPQYTAWVVGYDFE